jgi:hypothetical protein
MKPIYNDLMVVTLEVQEQLQNQVPAKVWQPIEYTIHNSAASYLIFLIKAQLKEDQ